MIYFVDNGWKCHSQCLSKLEKLSGSSIKGLKRGTYGDLIYVQLLMMRDMFSLCFEHLAECGAFRQTAIKYDLPKRLYTAVKFDLKAESRWQAQVFSQLSLDQTRNVISSIHKILAKEYQGRASRHKESREVYIGILKYNYGVVKIEEPGLNLPELPANYDFEDAKRAKVAYTTHTCKLCE